MSLAICIKTVTASSATGLKGGRMNKPGICSIINNRLYIRRLQVALNQGGSGDWLCWWVL